MSLVGSSSSSSCCRKRLTRESSTDEVGVFELVSGDSGDVSMSRDSWPSLFKHFLAVFIYLNLPYRSHPGPFEAEL
jgi:hypothetical protein